MSFGSRGGCACLVALRCDCSSWRYSLDVYCGRRVTFLEAVGADGSG